MNVTLIAQLLAVLGLSGLLVTSAVTVFSSSSASMSAATPSSSMSAEDEDVVNFQHRSRRYDHQEHRKPNIIIILADDMGWNDVSFHGSDQVPTPNIDAIAYNGIVLNKHYVPALCTPSRAALMTGKYPIHLGLQHSVILPAEPRGLPLTEKLLPEYLKDEGYSTYAVGKWHLGYYEKKYTPLFRGFDTHYGYWNGLQDYYTHMAREPNPTLNISAGYDMRRNLSVDWDAAGIYSTDLFTKESVRLINSHDPKDPMFLYLAHLAPHKGNPNQPLRAPAEEIAKFSYINDPERRIQAAVMSKLDQSVGEVVDALKARGMLENSIIIFMSDNGAPTDGILSNQGSNYPFRGIKNSPWEGGVRGAAAIWSPLIKASKRVSNQLMFMADWLPTLLSAAGAKSIRLRNIDGIDLWRSLVSDEISPRTEVLINIDDISNYAAIRRGDFKYVIGETDAGSAWLGASGQSSEGISPEYKPESVLNSKAGIAIASVITTRQDRVLTADKIVELRKEAEIKCNVKEEEKIPCNPRQAACLFNIEKDPCEMVNLADNRPVILTIMEMSLLKYRVTMVPPSNMEGDPQSNPALWNNTWTCWREPDPLHLEYDNEEKPVNYSSVTIAVISVVFGLFIISMFTVYAMTCNRCRSTNLEPRELHDTQEPMVHASIVEENKERCTNVQYNTKEAVE